MRAVVVQTGIDLEVDVFVPRWSAKVPGIFGNDGNDIEFAPTVVQSLCHARL